MSDLHLNVLENITEPLFNRILARALREFGDLTGEGDSPFAEVPAHGSNFVRLRPVPPREEVPFDVFFLSDASGRPLAYSKTRRFFWDGSPETVPQGWEALHHVAYAQRSQPNTTPNALSPFWIHNFSGEKGLALHLFNEVKQWAKNRGFARMFFPAKPSSQRTSPELAGMEFGEFANMKREDGLPADPWFRSLSRIAELIGWTSTGHIYSGTEKALKTSCSQGFPAGESSAVMNFDKSSAILAGWERVYYCAGSQTYTFLWGNGLFRAELQ